MTVSLCIPLQLPPDGPPDGPSHPYVLQALEFPSLMSERESKERKQAKNQGYFLFCLSPLHHIDPRPTPGFLRYF